MPNGQASVRRPWSRHAPVFGLWGYSHPASRPRARWCGLLSQASLRVERSKKRMCELTSRFGLFWSLRDMRMTNGNRFAQGSQR